MIASALLGSLLLTDPALAAVSGRATSSSVKRDDESGQRHSADQAVDGLLSEGWGEGEDGYGEGSWLELDLGRTTDVRVVSIWPGNLSEGKKSFREHSRPRRIKITLINGKESVEREAVLEDSMQRVDIDLSDLPGDARKIRIDVLEVYEGLVFSDLFIAEVGVNFLNCRDQLQPLIEWMDTDAATRAYEEHEADVRERYQSIKDAAFGDDDALDWIISQAGDGAEYIRKEAVRRVDVGFRVAAVRPSDLAIRALDQLKDPNGVPGLEMAALRAFPTQAADLIEKTEMLYAYQELIGGPRYSVPAWGDTGWEKGALRGFGEPLPLEIDDQGMIYVADMGNSRIQRFDSETGLVDRVWGAGEPDISDAWIGDGRPWYVSGAAPGEGPGQFRNPMDVVLMPDKKLGSSFAVLDAGMQIQVFDPDGVRVAGWSVPSGSTLQEEVGGEAFLMYIPKKDYLFAVVKNRLYGYTATGEELGEWKLEDGTPQAVEVSRDRKLLMAFNQDIVMYDLDGFRHGVVITEEQLGGGFEGMDLTLDEDGRLWVLTDQGVAYKFKSYSRLDYSVPVSERSLRALRIAVDDDRLYITEGDEILRIDAMQIKIDQEAAAEEAAAE